MKAASEIRYCIFEIRTGPKNGTFKEQEKTPELKNGRCKFTKTGRLRILRRYVPRDKGMESERGEKLADECRRPTSAH